MFKIGDRPSFLVEVAATIIVASTEVVDPMVQKSEVATSSITAVGRLATLVVVE